MKYSSNKKEGLLGWLENNLNGVIIVSCILIVVVPFIFSLPAFCRFFEVHEGHNVGDAIGGITAPIIGIASILLLCITLKAQKDASNKSELENRIFQMIGLHRKNVEEMHSEAKNLDGQDVFNMISKQIDECAEDVSLFLRDIECEQVYSADFLKSLKEIRPEADCISFARLDISYSIVYIGVRDEYIETLKTLLCKRYKEDFIWPLLLCLRLRLVNNIKEGYKEWKDFCEETIADRVRLATAIWEANPSSPEYSKKALLRYPNLCTNHNKLYWGHSFRLGHYFRHLYSTVEYIDSQDNLTDDERYEYVKILRTQLSNTEQMVFVANSFSDMGGPWELFRKEKDNKHYITTYNLIKNIPQEEIYGVKYRQFFPNVQYEF